MHSRRERYRSETRQEAKRIATEQLAESGPGGISVNAIAKRMGITGPALYRYFASRDELLTELIRDAYEELADTVEEVARRAARKGPAGRLRDMAAAFRGWALEHPHRYLLLFGTPVPGYRAPEDTIAAANRTLAAFAEVLAELPARDAPVRPAGLGRQLAAFAAARNMDLPPATLLRAIQAWTRMHGLVSLEVEGQFEPTGVDPELLFRAELEMLIEP